MSISSTNYIPHDWSRPLAPVTLEGHTYDVWSVIELKDGKLASSSQDNTIKIWDRQQKQCVATLKGHTNWVYSVIEHYDGKLASCSREKTLKIWDAEPTGSAPPSAVEESNRSSSSSDVSTAHSQGVPHPVPAEHSAPTESQPTMGVSPSFS